MYDLLYDLENDLSRFRFPCAVLHRYNLEGMESAARYALRLADNPKNGNWLPMKRAKIVAVQYVENCIKTNGNPNLIDLYGGES